MGALLHVSTDRPSGPIVVQHPALGPGQPALPGAVDQPGGAVTGPVRTHLALTDQHPLTEEAEAAWQRPR